MLKRPRGSYKESLYSVLFSLSLLLGSQALPCPGAESLPKPTPSTLVDLVRQAKVINADYPLNIVISGKEATVLTRKHPKATDEDVKIDAVLITKAIMDSYGFCLDSVKVLFRADDGTSAKKVSVNEADIQNYANGSMDAHKFLDTLKLVEIDSDGERAAGKPKPEENGLAVSAGPMQDQRLILADRIMALKKRGTGVGPFEKLFAEADHLAVENKLSELKTAVKTLAERLNEQEELIRQAARLEKGHGIRGGSTSGSSAGTSSSSGKTSSSSFSSQSAESRLNQSLGGRRPEGGLSANAERDQLYLRVNMALRRRSFTSDTSVYYSRLERMNSYKDSNPEQCVRDLKQMASELGITGNEPLSSEKPQEGYPGMGPGGEHLPPGGPPFMR